MPNVTIYIPSMKLKKIDAYCKEKKKPRGVFLANSALSVINASGGFKCDYCNNSAVGKYRITVYDTTLGETDLDKNMCEYHLNKAKKETEVHEL